MWLPQDLGLCERGETRPSPRQFSAKPFTFIGNNEGYISHLGEAARGLGAGGMLLPGAKVLFA